MPGGSLAPTQVRVVYEFDSPDEAAGFVKGIDDQARERRLTECEVCDALGLGQVERANAHPHRLIEVARAGLLDRHEADLGKGLDDLT
jgi:hypothetical protein